MVTRDSLTKTVEERFWDRVERGDGCWLWGGSKDKDGYGKFTPVRNHSCLAHRYAFELLVGPIPEGMELDHVRDRGCTGPSCVNPAHLEPVSHRENVRRAFATRSPMTTCTNGHALSGDNVRTDGRGWRVCRTCVRERAAAARVRKAAHSAQ